MARRRSSIEMETPGGRPASGRRNGFPPLSLAFFAGVAVEAFLSLLDESAEEIGYGY